MENEKLLPQITDCKLRKVINKVKIVDTDSTNYKYDVVEMLKLPLSTDIVYDRSQTDIDWVKMPNHYEFNTNKMGWEEKIKDSFGKSELNNTKDLIIPYGWKEPVILIPTEIFIDNWEDFLVSVYYQTIIFSEDYKLVMEISRDYHLHSNFEIMKDKDYSKS